MILSDLFQLTLGTLARLNFFGGGSAIKNKNGAAAHFTIYVVK